MIIHGESTEQVLSYKYLGVNVDSTLSWAAHIDYLHKRVQQRICFLQRLTSFGASKHILVIFQFSHSEHLFFFLRFLFFSLNVFACLKILGVLVSQVFQEGFGF